MSNSTSHNDDNGAPDLGTLSNRGFIGMMAASMALVALAIDAMLPALRMIGRDLAAPATLSPSLIITSFIVGLGCGALVYGPLADRYGRRPVLIGGLLAYAILAAACALATDFRLMLILRFFMGFSGAALNVLPVAIVRDRFHGDRMAQMMSMIFIVFMIVPILAPAIGQGIMLLAPWRAIFAVMATAALGIALWVVAKLPETLRPSHVRPLALRQIATDWWTVASQRKAMAYTIGAAVAHAGLFGYINTGSDVFEDVFRRPHLFPLAFAGVAVCLAIANFVNARIVRRLGARRVGHSALVAYVGFGAAQLAAAQWAPGNMALAMFLLALTMSMIGLMGSNFSAIAMEDCGAIAGAASSVQSFLRNVIAALGGAAIAASYDGTAKPMAAGFVICGIVALVIIGIAARADRRDAASNRSGA